MLVSVLLVLGGALGLAGEASAGPPRPVSADLRCDPGDRSCDQDGDRIPDAVEQAVCGSVTCATGHEDDDGDGVPDWVERLASRSTTAVDPGADRDADGMPDYAERLTCGSAVCATGREDVDGDGVRDWAEVVICGDATCATGSEDYDGDGVSDADQLHACVVYDRGTWWGDLARTGGDWWPLLLAALGALGAGAWLVRRRSAALATESGPGTTERSEGAR
ncbi:hypothetical protein [Cellulomonas endometrii]|uniref:hypothetical protein n=1 Tax=Cellulomonas endometrii TaxID=3036301 RepID=UPI0024AE2216|nr:hypothetical protein [Cellulomonas endometrii]